jgi:MFS family permease
MYLAFRCASGLGMGGMGLAAFALATEVSGPSWRAFVGLLINLFFSGEGAVPAGWLGAVCGSAGGTREARMQRLTLSNCQTRAHLR